MNRKFTKTIRKNSRRKNRKSHKKNHYNPFPKYKRNYKGGVNIFPEEMNFSKGIMNLKFEGENKTGTFVQLKPPGIFTAEEFDKITKLKLDKSESEKDINFNLLFNIQRNGSEIVENDKLNRKNIVINCGSFGGLHTGHVEMTTQAINQIQKDNLAVVFELTTLNSGDKQISLRGLLRRILQFNLNYNIPNNIDKNVKIFSDFFPYENIEKFLWLTSKGILLEKFSLLPPDVASINCVLGADTLIRIFQSKYYNDATVINFQELFYSKLFFYVANREIPLSYLLPYINFSSEYDNNELIQSNLRTLTSSLLEKRITSFKLSSEVNFENFSTVNITSYSFDDGEFVPDIFFIKQCLEINLCNAQNKVSVTLQEMFKNENKIITILKEDGKPWVDGNSSSINQVMKTGFK